MESTQSFGAFVEGIACEYAKSRRYDILARNYRKPWGEIDIVAKEGKVVVFIEVKGQKGMIRGFRPEDHFTHEKHTRLLRACHSYLLENKYDEDTEYRIDLAAIIVSQRQRKARVYYYRNVTAEMA